MTTVSWHSLGGVLADLFQAEAPGVDFGERYKVERLLGGGGQGEVHLARDQALDRWVAVKCARDPGAGQEHLQRESRLLARLAHPAIPQVYDRGHGADGGVFVVLQYAEGQRLDHHLTTASPALADRLALVRLLAEAVAHAHRRGILHRDLKPENVIVAGDGAPMLVDWGLAATGDPRAICGSPHFAAPEQLDGQVADRRADVYALGVLLYYVLCEELPYGRSVRDFREFVRQRAGLQRLPLRSRRPDLPAALERICETAMAAQPGARYQRVEELIADLDAFAAGRPLARDVPRLPWLRLLATIGLPAALVLGAVGGWLVAARGLAAPAPPTGGPRFGETPPVAPLPAPRFGEVPPAAPTVPVTAPTPAPVPAPAVALPPSLEEAEAAADASGKAPPPASGGPAGGAIGPGR